ncbi:orotidine-5'-phosphate decarboxylase [Saccharomonospora xinjiangensis]|uniref:orotidine-5'-phosphate decarboxylase n=1 Tax=Saccharomonospora xinjiangensis TaxID=75294 RepID=UPI0010700D5A|nr:orotidine-5'-phosphate decarboxylase [Saccharomonospora xinjiangensis]QBQ60127.1 orotidine 5'-phosphate decarboxylase [Saccharomonospora xinjiangensis]
MSAENTAARPFGARLAEAVAERGPLCVGVDPHPELLRSWGLPVDASGLERFALTATEALAGSVAVLKPQSAFFETYGSAGIAVLERVLATARQAGALVLLDVKRGDIGSTMAAYTDAYLADGAPLAVDAITVSPYLGFGSLEPALAKARSTGRGVFVLARTSNPEGHTVQRARDSSGTTVAQSIVDAAARCNAGAEPLGDVGVVVGATVGPGEVRLDTFNGPVLAPGFGAQGATAEDVRRVFGAGLRGLLPASSRDVLRHGPSPDALLSAARRAADSLAAILPSS